MDLYIRIEAGFESTPKSLLDEQDGVGSSQPSPLPLPHAPQYNIVRDRERRQVIPPKRYVEADLVAYALNVAESVDTCEEPSTYEDSSMWMIAMQEEIGSLYKNRT